MPRAALPLVQTLTGVVKHQAGRSLNRGVAHAPGLQAVSGIILYEEHFNENMDELIRKLEEEIATLENEFRVELPREILKARAHGDLSENAEYHAAKERQGFVNARLGQLKARLRDLSMIDMSKIPHDRVGLGSRVVVLDVSKDERIHYKLVTSEEVDVAKGLISTSSPIGKGLLGKQVGDTVKIQIPSGVREMEIIELLTIHEKDKTA